MNTRICPECGAEFRPLHGSQVCCSDECKRNRLRMQRRESKRCNARIRKLSPHQRMLANLRRRDLLAPKPKIEIIERNGISHSAVMPWASSNTPDMFYLNAETQRRRESGAVPQTPKTLCALRASAPLR